jgi:hypothetical protein
MYWHVPVGLALVLGFVALSATEAAAQNKSKAPRVIYRYYSAPTTMYYAAPPAKSYVAPPVSYYAAPSAYSPAPNDLPTSSPGYQGSWRNSRN